MTETLASTLGTIFGKAFSKDGKYAKIFVFIACFTGSFFFMAYRASLTSKLAITKTELPFQDMQELYTSDYNLYVWDSAGGFTYSVKNPVPNSASFWASKKVNQNPEGNGYVSVEDGVNKLEEKSEKNAFFTVKNSIDFNNQYNTCNLKIPFTAVSYLAGFAVQKDSEYLPVFSKFMKEIRRNGILERLKQKYMVEHSMEYHYCPSDSLDIGLGFNKIGSLWMMLFITYILAVMMLIIEIVRKRRLKITNMTHVLTV